MYNEVSLWRETLSSKWIFLSKEKVDQRMLMFISLVACSHNQRFTSFLSHLFTYSFVQSHFVMSMTLSPQVLLPKYMYIYMHLNALFLLYQISPWMPLSVAFPTPHDKTEGKHSFPMIQNPIPHVRNSSLSIHLRLIRARQKIYMATYSLNGLYNTHSNLSSGIFNSIKLSSQLFFVELYISQDNPRWKSVSILV